MVRKTYGQPHRRINCLLPPTQKSALKTNEPTSVCRRLGTDCAIEIICLVNTYDIFRSIFELDEEAEQRIQLICQMDLIGRSIAEAVEQNLAGPLLRRSHLTKQIPSVPLRQLLRNPHLREGNVPALFADLTQKYGPVFEIRPPFAKPMIFIAGAQANRWVHRHGRLYLKPRTILPTSRKPMGRMEYCLPWMVPITSGCARR